jgi:hypothetical protein
MATMRTITALLVILSASASLAACTPYGEIRVVKTSKSGGEMALLGVRDLARQKAEAEMARACGANNFEVLEEGEAVVGQVEHAQGSTSSTNGRTIFGRPAAVTSGSSQTETTQKTEWRLKYSCRGEGGSKPTAGAQIREVVVVF